MKLAISTKTGQRLWPFAKRLRALLDAGFTRFELYPSDVTKENVSVIKRWRSHKPVEIVSLHFSPPPGFVLAGNENLLIDQITARRETVGDLSFSIFGFHSGALPVAGGPVLLQKVLQRLCESVPSCTFLVENEKGEAGLWDVEGFQQLDFPPNGGILFDNHHAIAHQLDEREFVELLRHHIKAVHLADYTRSPALWLELLDDSTHLIIEPPNASTDLQLALLRDGVQAIPEPFRRSLLTFVRCPRTPPA
jgi:hypothetical protein